MRISCSLWRTLIISYCSSSDIEIPKFGYSFSWMVWQWIELKFLNISHFTISAFVKIKKKILTSCQGDVRGFWKTFDCTSWMLLTLAIWFISGYCPILAGDGYLSPISINRQKKYHVMIKSWEILSYIYIQPRTVNSSLFHIMRRQHAFLIFGMLSFYLKSLITGHCILITRATNTVLIYDK